MASKLNCLCDQPNQQITYSINTGANSIPNPPIAHVMCCHCAAAILHRCASQHTGGPCPPCGVGCIQSKLDPRFPNSWSFTFLCQNPAQMVVHSTPPIPFDDPLKDFDIQSLFTDDIVKASKDKMLFSPEPILLDEQSKIDLAKHLERLAHDADQPEPSSHLQASTQASSQAPPEPSQPESSQTSLQYLPFQNQYNYVYNSQYSNISDDSFTISGYPSTATLIPDPDDLFRPPVTSTPFRSHSQRTRHPTDDKVSVSKVHRRSLP